MIGIFLILKQRLIWWFTISYVYRVVSAAKVQKIWEQFTTRKDTMKKFGLLFRLQKYKKFESNSQPSPAYSSIKVSCFGCKSTKNLRAIHNNKPNKHNQLNVVSAAKVQKIWEQFTTGNRVKQKRRELFRLQKYKKFESNSQQGYICAHRGGGCFGCKSTKNLRAIHNKVAWVVRIHRVVSAAKVQKIWEQFTTRKETMKKFGLLFRLQKYKKFESNSQPIYR